MWSDFYRNGGWGMYPTTLFGFLLIAAVVLMLVRGEHRYFPLAVRLGVLTMCSGMLGLAVGLVATFRYLGGVVPEEQVKIAALGCAESLNNIILALLITVVAALLASLSALRNSKANANAG